MQYFICGRCVRTGLKSIYFFSAEIPELPFEKLTSQVRNIQRNLRKEKIPSPVSSRDIKIKFRRQKFPQYKTYIFSLPYLLDNLQSFKLT